MFQKFQSIQWFDISNRQKEAIFKQFEKLNEIEVTFYESGINFETDYSVVRTSPFPILSLYWFLSIKMPEIVRNGPLEDDIDFCHFIIDL